MKKEEQKEPVRIRLKNLANGNKSIYLDIYQDGRRKYEFLKMYLVPETGRDKKVKAKKNEEMMQIANAIKSQRIIQLANDKAGIFEKPSKNILLTDWVDMYYKYKQKVSRASTLENILKTKKHLVIYGGDKVKLCDVDKKYIEGFIDYLKNAKDRRATKNEKLLSRFTIGEYYSVFVSLMRKAVREGLIYKNPCDMIDNDRKIKRPDSDRVYLTLSEVRRISEVSFKNENIKRAFMFACFTGLRISDIRKLSWEDIEKDGDTYKLTTLMQKTSRYVSYSLSKEALRWILPMQDEGLVFGKLPLQFELNKKIRELAEKAGVKKHISFHTSRHTFATMMLTLGADIYTTSKLLGHTKVTTTEIYAKIIDKKKDDAMGLIDKYFEN